MCDWCTQHQGLFWQDDEAPEWTGQWAVYECYCPFCNHRWAAIMPGFMEPWECHVCEQSPVLFGDGILKETNSGS